MRMYISRCLAGLFIIQPGYNNGFNAGSGSRDGTPIMLLNYHRIANKKMEEGVKIERKGGT